MVTVVYKSLTSVRPVELKYQYNHNELLQTKTVGYAEGINLYTVDGFDNFEDTSVNKGSCFVLTTAINLSAVFKKQPPKGIGEIPLTLKLLSTPTYPGLSGNFYAVYEQSTDTIIKIPTLSSSATNFFFNPIDGISKVEILVGNKYLQADPTYPYTIKVGDKITETSQEYRQHFYCENYNNIIAIKTKTADVGFRYLTFCRCGTLRGTGVILNADIVNNYLISAVDVTPKNLNYDFTPDNKWVTYFLDFPSQVFNKDISLNKTFDTQINLLVDFPLEPAIKNRIAQINIANLKTSLTPTSLPPQVDNSYNEQIITTN